MPRAGRKKDDEKRSYLKQTLAIIEKFEAEDRQGHRLPLHLSIIERDAVAQALRLVWLPTDELHRYRQQQKLKHIEATKKLAKHGVRFGNRTEFVQKVTGYDDSPEALKQFVRRHRKRRR
jgi:hypothetical protein